LFVNDANVRPLLEWLLRQHPDTPRSRAKQWILAGRVSVNGEVIRKPHHSIADPGNGLELGGRQSATLECGSGWQIHPEVSLLYLDPALAVVNKGPGLISVPAADSGPSALSILADLLCGKLQPRDPPRGFKVPPAFRHLRPLRVHRLDRFTSGVFCMAMNPAARASLIEQLNAHTVTREYVAFVEGRAGDPRGSWRQWLLLSRDETRQQVVSEKEGRAAGEKAQEAITHYEVMAEYPLAGGKRFATKLRLRLETGRRHQIRVQATHAGLPLIGDRTYGPGLRGRDAGEGNIAFSRQALHAELLSLEHPAQPGRRMTWKAEIPKDLRRLEAALRAGGLK
jgi:23S rRNA pseudouridine1911/1915/1917 synthase